MREQTRRNYDEFVAKNGHEPRYAYCRVTFDYDNHATMDATIKLTCDEDENDDLIFFYCEDGINEILSLYEKDDENDFHISSVATFGMEP